MSAADQDFCLFVCGKGMWQEVESPELALGKRRNVQNQGDHKGWK